MALAHELYEETEDTQAAIEMPREIVAADRRPRSNPSSASNQRSAGTDAQPISTSTFAATNTSPEKLAHNVVMRLKDECNKFYGDFGQSWMKYVDEHLQICRYYKLNPTKNLYFLHSLLREDAK